jgi:DNA (cytosine-5-)-methyltransferase|nr:MAG TPA: Cytosine specific methyltransferase [Bacteriophage sp.]
MKFIDFFAGIGGFHSGLEKADMKCVGWCEFDKFAQKSYRAMYDTERLWFADDVRKVRGWDLPKADLWTFGFPCQDVSIAGKQKGIKRGTRSGLFYEIMRLIDEAEENRPEWLICENVKNLLSIDGGRGFFEVLTEMGGRGYTIEWRIYNSKDYGVPQNRERVYIVGRYGDSTGQPLLPIRRESTAALGQIISGSQGERVYDGNKISCTLSSQGGGCGAKTGLYTFVDINKKGSVQTTDTARALLARCNKGQPNRPAECSGVIEAGRLFRAWGNATPVKVMPILTPDRLEKRQNGRRIKNEGEPSFTLTGQDRHGVLIVDGHIKIRKLTPRECFRLQGFTDEQFDRAAAVNSETQLYKQAGNAVTVNVVEAIGRHIKEVASQME